LSFAKTNSVTVSKTRSKTQQYLLQRYIAEALRYANHIADLFISASYVRGIVFLSRSSSLHRSLPLTKKESLILCFEGVMFNSDRLVDIRQRDVRLPLRIAAGKVNISFIWIFENLYSCEGIVAVVLQWSVGGVLISLFRPLSPYRWINTESVAHGHAV